MSVSKAYAKALFESINGSVGAANVSTTCDLVELEMRQFFEVTQKTADIKTALYGPVTTAKEKTQIVSGLLEKSGAHEVSKKIITLMVQKKRLGILTQVADVFRAVRLEAEGGVIGLLVSAEPMTEAEVQELSKAFSSKLGKKVSFQTTTDPTLLAGLKVTIQGVTYDGALRSQLDRVKQKLMSPGAISH